MESFNQKSNYGRNIHTVEWKYKVSYTENQYQWVQLTQNCVSKSTVLE